MNDFNFATRAVNIHSFISEPMVPLHNPMQGGTALERRIKLVDATTGESVTMDASMFE